MAEEKRKMVELSPEEEKENNLAVMAHVFPFAIWLTMMVWLDNPEWNYNARTLGGIALLVAFRPWRWYPRLKLKNIPLGIGVGVLIFIVWVGLETPWMVEKAPAVTEWYDRLFVDLIKPFRLRELFDVGGGVMAPFEVIEEGPHAGLHVYDPNVTGWPNFWVHMFGTSVVIAVIEEFFFRGFLYRWMMGSPFFKIPMNKLHWPLLFIISAFFGIEHFEWMAGIICGLAFGLLAIKTGDIWASIIAHGTTNFLLGLYVIKYNAYQFW
ncbi:MAG: CAAX prenyl protease-related protein [Kiritimatiellales bacterium]|nr:CAAX prenyl protease-related protein [Kiritimatiellales bacterium]